LISVTRTELRGDLEMPDNIEFIWDPEKARLNWRKHHVTFEEATTAFDDPFALIIPDEAHSANETRELLIGYAAPRRLLFVVFIERTHNIVRLISARMATAGERKRYEQEKRY
jgi:hypothetical protein